MKIPPHHSWNITPRAAIALQRGLAQKVVARGRPAEIGIVAGVDLGFTADGKAAIGGIVCYRFPELIEIERVHAFGPVNYPYVPGLLTFREGPVLEHAFERMTHTPDVVLFDGHGIAHPRRLGIASHMGLLLGKPAVGCGKSRLCGIHDSPGPCRGDRTPLWDEKSGETIGVVLRTRDNVKPIFVSAGHLISLDAAVEIVMACLDRTRIPKPTREADRYVRFLK